MLGSVRFRWLPSWRVLVALLPHPVRTPLTFWYLAVLLITTVLQQALPHRLAHAMVSFASTDAANLARHPVFSIVTSAFVLPGPSWFASVLLFSVFVAPLERRVGWRWTAGVFGSGHVIATLVTELPVSAAIAAEALPSSAARWVDVGVSYGFFATAGALVWLLHRRPRLVALGALDAFALVIYCAGGFGLDGTVTVFGHLLAVHVGLVGWHRWMANRGLLGTVPLRLPRRAPAMMGT